MSRSVLVAAGAWILVATSARAQQAAPIHNGDRVLINSHGKKWMPCTLMSDRTGSSPTSWSYTATCSEDKYSLDRLSLSYRDNIEHVSTRTCNPHGSEGGGHGN